MRKLKLHHWIFIGMGVGLLIGGTMNVLSARGTWDAQADSYRTTVWWFNLLGKDLFVGSLKMIIAPLIFASIVAGISSLPDMKELGAIGWKTLAYYVLTTSLAVGIGLAAVLLIQPGAREASQKVRAQRQRELDGFRAEFKARHPGANLDDPVLQKEYLAFVALRSGETAAQGLKQWKRIQRTRERGFGDMFREDILLKVLENPFASLSASPPNSLGVIFFAILTGLACMALGERARPAVNFFSAFNHIMMQITLWVMSAAPVAIGCIIAALVAKLGLSALYALSWYCLTVVGGIAVHVAALLTIVATLGGMNPIAFFQGIWSAWLIAFCTTSSAATLPVTLECVTDNLKVSPKVANFSLPVGATVNMDGTALYEGVAVIFMLQLYGGMEDVQIHLSAAQTFMIFLTAVLASVGAAAVPSAGLITMAIVANAVGLPLYYIVFIYSVDHLLDMFRTSTNVLGDAVGAVVVNRMEAKRLGAAGAAGAALEAGPS